MFDNTKQWTSLSCPDHDISFGSPAQAAVGHETVAMNFPHDVILRLDGGVQQKIHYPAGVHEVPAHLADHWYLAANDVTRCTPLPEPPDNSVEMIFPRDVRLTIYAGAPIFFPMGVNKVPAHLVDHWYLKAHGVTRVVPTEPEPLPPAA